MKVRLKRIYIFEIALLIFEILYFLLMSNYNNPIGRSFVIVCFLGILLVPAIYFLGYKKDNSFDRETAIKIEISVFVGFFFICFLLGILIGFSKTAFSFDVDKVLNGFIPVLIFLVVEEVFRYTLIKSTYINKSEIVILTILLIILNVLLEMNIGFLDNKLRWFIFISITIFPIIAQELLCSYMTYNFGLLPSLVFKVLAKCYIYIFPFFPNLNDYLYGTMHILIPFVIYLADRKYIVKINRLDRRRGKENRFSIGFMTRPLIIALIALIILVSGIFRYQLIAIASNSMIPVYYKGDAVLVDKKNPKDTLVGEILIYQKSGKIIAHRVVKKVEYEEQVFFYTKGDANNNEDSYLIEEEDIIGKVVYVCKYIGWPTVWFNEFLRKE